MVTYRAAPPDALKVVPLDDLTLVYHRPAAATHLLAEPAPQIIAALQEQPSDLAGLAARFDVSEDERAVLAERIDELVAVGLVTST